MRNTLDVCESSEQNTQKRKLGPSCGMCCLLLSPTTTDWQLCHRFSNYNTMHATALLEPLISVVRDNDNFFHSSVVGFVLFNGTSF